MARAYMTDEAAWLDPDPADDPWLRDALTPDAGGPMEQAFDADSDAFLDAEREVEHDDEEERR